MTPRVPLWSCLTVLFLSIAPSTPVNAADWSIHGGQVLPDTDTALEVGIGWPGTRVAYHYPIQTNLEIIPAFELFYGTPVVVDSWATLGIGNCLGAQVRWQFLEKRGIHLAATGELGALINYSLLDEVAGGLRIGAGLALDYSASETVNLITGFEIPADIYFVDSRANIPMLVSAGLEFTLTSNFMLYAITEFGPGISAFGDAGSAGFGVKGSVGLSHRFQ